MSRLPPKPEHSPTAQTLQSTAQSKSPRQSASVGLAIATTTAGVLPVFLTGALAVQLEAHLHVGTTAIGGAVATFFGASALSSVRGGRLAERIGPYKIMVAAVGVALIGLLGIALLVDSLPGLLGFLFIGGLSNGAIQPAANLLVARVVDDHHQGLAFGVKQAAVPTSTLLSGVAVPAIALTAGWHAAFVAAAGLAFVVGAFLVLRGHRYMPGPAAASRSPGRAEGDGKQSAGEQGAALADAGEQGAALADAGEQGAGERGAGEQGAGERGAGERGAGERGAGERGAGAQTARPADGGADRRSDHARGHFDARPLISLGAAMACAVAASNAMGSFVVPGAVHAGLAPGLAGLVSAAGSIVGLSMRVGFGWRADRRGLRGRRAADAHLKTVATLIAFGALGYGALAAGTLGLLLPAVLLAYGGGWGYNGLFNLAVVRAYPQSPARATGVTQVGTYIGGMAGPLGFGIVVDHLGYHVGWTLCAALAVMAVTGFTLSRRRLRATFEPTRTIEPGGTLEGYEESSREREDQEDGDQDRREGSGALTRDRRERSGALTRDRREGSGALTRDRRERSGALSRRRSRRAR